MKAKQLMLGNYALYNGLTVRVRNIHDNVFLDGGDESVEVVYDDGVVVLVDPCSLEPIPLTPEILEKNGFKFDGSGQRSMMFISKPQFSDGIRFNIYVGLKHKTIESFAAHPVEKSSNWRKSNKVCLEVCGCYVHELQNALLLCGIEKEITI